MVNSRISYEGQERFGQMNVGDDNRWAGQQARQDVSKSARSILRRRTSEEVDERTPLLTSSTERAVSGVASRREEGDRRSEAMTQELLLPSSHNQVVPNSLRASCSVDRTLNTSSGDQSRWHRAMGG